MATTNTQDEINNNYKKFNSTIKKKEVFDPRIIENDSSRQLWSSESVELAVKGLSEGYKLKENPYLKSVQGALLRKANLPFKYTEDEIKIIEICATDKEWFCDNFGKLKDGDKGWTNINLRPYQRDLLKRYDKNRWNIIMFPRQSGKTTTTVLEIVHFCTFNIDKDCVVIAQSDKVVNEILSKIKEAFAGLPFFMQPGFTSFNKKGFTLDNGCRLSIGIASESVVQGFALDLLYIDEFAYIKPSLASKFWNNVYPTLINNPNSKCIITSTPNGRNLFYELWANAEAKRNKFIPYRIYWHDVPGRDDQFKWDTIANVGIEGWEMGFECSFDTTLKSIFMTKVQKELRGLQLRNMDNWSRDNDVIGNQYNIEFINKEVIQYDLKEDFFLIGIDLGEGLEQDKTTAKFKKLEWDKENKRIRFRSIGVFSSDTTSVEDFAQWVLDVGKYFNPNKVRFVVENNTYGSEFFSHIDALRIIEKQYANFDKIVFAKFMRESKSDYEYGIRWNKYNKKIAVKSFSDLITKGDMEESHNISVEEYLNFGKQKNGTYSAQYGHDDLVMGDVTISHFIKSNNMYATAFLNEAKSELRFRTNDEDEEVKRKKEEEIRKQKNIYKHNGFQLRNHVDEYNKLHEHDTDIYLLML